MLKNKIAVFGALAVFSFAFALPILAQADSGSGCGFWGNLFGTCTRSSQPADVLSSTSSTSGETNRENGRGLKNMTSSAIACVATAVATRESSLDSGMTTYTTAVNAAYAKRATDLATAYAQASTTDIKVGIRVAWNTFNASKRSAGKAWQTARLGAWNTFRTAARACKAPSIVDDSGNSGSEMNGQ